MRPGTGAGGDEDAGRAPDDLDVGWERADEVEGSTRSGRDDEWYRRERPPHW